MSIEQLLQTNVNGHTEKKNNLTYLSWAWAWAEALKADPAATYKVETFQEHGQNGSCRTVPYMNINGTCMVWVTVTLFGKPATCQLPVMDYRNKAIPEPDAFAVNTAIMRCMTKALSLHGLGLYIYAGEDLPENAPTDEAKLADWLAAIDASTNQDELKANYLKAYKEFANDVAAQKQIIAAKDAKKVVL